MANRKLINGRHRMPNRSRMPSLDRTDVPDLMQGLALTGEGLMQNLGRTEEGLTPNRDRTGEVLTQNPGRTGEILTQGRGRTEDRGLMADRVGKTVYTVEKSGICPAFFMVSGRMPFSLREGSCTDSVVLCLRLF